LRSITILAFACALLLVETAYAAAASVKVLVPRGASVDLAGASLVADYGAFAVYSVAEGAADALLAAAPAGVRRLDETIAFDAQQFQPGRDALRVPTGFGAPESIGPGLQLVQFVAPVREAWLDAVRATGAQPIHYVANQGYLVWADAAERAALDAMAAARDVLQHSAPLPAWFKLGPTLRARFGDKAAAIDSEARIPVVVQMVRHEHREIAEAEIERLLTRVDSPWTALLAYQNVFGEMRLGDVAALAARGDVVHVGERLPRELFDEVQNQIIAGNFNFDQSGPSGPGYLTFLAGLGFSTTPADYPIVDITDDGIGNGTVASNDPTLHELGLLANPTRLAYVANCTNSASGEGVDGHGHINTSIVGGYDTRSGFPFQDLDTYQRGLGVNPYARLGGHRIFDPGFDQSSCGGTDTGVIQAVWQAGGRINSNSWGCSGCAGSYDDGSQAYDVGVRDADLGAAGNQELIVVFSAGNSGPSAATVGTPGNGKNMITVGASENDRPSDEDGNWTDGCLVGPTGADDAMDVIDFSSRGPSPGGRTKPEVIAPGTHIQGTASTNAGYTGNGVCDQFRPSAQTTFAASSGTSHSCPAVAGVASLIYYWLENGFATVGPASLTPPSPAMVKAYLMAHPTYLTGVDANDTLPSNSQGYGMPDLGTMFDDSDRYLVDQSETFDNTGETWTWIGAVADVTKPVRIAFAYTDQAGAIGTSPQVNNLDLEAEIDGTTYFGNEFSGEWSVAGGSADAANNYEAIFLPAGTAGAIEITVTATNVAGDGVPNAGDATDQDFALVCYNCVQEPTFTIVATPSAQSICTPSAAIDLHAERCALRPRPRLGPRVLRIGHALGERRARGDDGRVLRQSRRADRFVDDDDLEHRRRHRRQLHDRSHRHLDFAHAPPKRRAHGLHRGAWGARLARPRRRRRGHRAHAGALLESGDAGGRVPRRGRDRRDLHQCRALPGDDRHELAGRPGARPRHRVLLARDRIEHLRRNGLDAFLLHHGQSRDPAGGRRQQLP